MIRLMLILSLVLSLFAVDSFAQCNSGGCSQVQQQARVQAPLISPERASLTRIGRVSNALVQAQAQAMAQPVATQEVGRRVNGVFIASSGPTLLLTSPEQQQKARLLIVSR